jgi:fibronectin type 3 domain-containing protein
MYVPEFIESGGERMKKVVFILIFIAAAAAAGQAQLAAKVQRKVIPDSPTQHQVALTWTQSTTAGVTGNNVYRGAASGGPYSLIYGSATPITAYTDTSVTGGSTYYYVVTAFIGSEESAYSNQFQATIPVAPAAPTGLTGTAQ